MESGISDFIEDDDPRSIIQAYVDGPDGGVIFTLNGIKHWWPKFRYAGVDPKGIKTKPELQYAVRRVAVVAFRETGESARQELQKRKFMSRAHRCKLEMLAASPREFENRLMEWWKSCNNRES